MSDSNPPATGRALKHWRTAARAYRDTIRNGYGHERALQHAAAVVLLTSRELSRPEARALTEAAVGWVLEHRPDWLDGGDNPTPT